MINLLATFSEEQINVVWLCVEYGVCLLVIASSILALSFFKRKTKREMRAETVKNSCLKAKKYAESILNDGEHKGAYILLGSTKLGHLSSCAADAAWYAFQIVKGKRDIVYEDIANSLDALATELSSQSENGYVPVGEYRACVEKAIARLDVTIQKLDVLMQK